MTELNTESIETNRMLNDGKEIKLTSIGIEGKVRELSLKSILELGSELSDLLVLIYHESDNKTEDFWIKWIMKSVAEPKSFEVLCKLIAASMGHENHTAFSKIGVSDALRWAVEFKTVTNFGELKELFFQLVPKTTIDQMMGTKEGMGLQK